MERSRLIRAIRRIKVTVWIIVLVVGIACIGLSLWVSPKDINLFCKPLEEKSEDGYEFVVTGTSGYHIDDALMGVGTGIVATCIVSFMLIVFLIDEHGNELIEEWGIEKIYAERFECKIEENSFPEKQLDIIAFGLSNFRRSNNTPDIIAAKINNGLVFRIITLHPDSAYIREQERFECTSQIQKDILDLQEWVSTVNAQIGDVTKHIQVRYYDTLPLHFYCREDDQVFVGPYIPAWPSNKTITSQYSHRGKVGQFYARLFEDIWNEKNQGISLLKKENSIITGKQNKAISQVLDYFATNFQGTTDSKVRGVVVIFKGELRRTFFSTSLVRGEEEKHAIRNREDGAIQRLLELNKKNNGEIYVQLFKDYDNQYVIKQIINNSRDTIITQHDGNKKESQPILTDITRYILLSPIFYKGKMIGAVTFDFEKMPENYKTIIGMMNSKKEGDKLKGDDLGILEKWFDDLKCCNKIVSNMIGHHIEIEYQELEGSKWN